LVLESFRYGDRGLVDASPELDDAWVVVHFHGLGGSGDLEERWGRLGDYRLAQGGAVEVEG
jgi:hypothetical protein